ncbi:hypothetical protein GGH95_004865, partial [Coemansia sp. RSA 1836]
MSYEAESGLLEFGELEIEVSDVEESTSSKKRARKERINQFRMSKRRNEAYATVLRVEGIASAADLFSQQPSRIICIVNIGYTAKGVATQQLLELVFKRHGGFERVIVQNGKPYSFAVFLDISAAQSAYAEIHEKPCPEFKNKSLLL